MVTMNILGFMKIFVGKATLLLGVLVKFILKYICVMKMCDILKAKNAFVKSVYSVVEYIICGLVTIQCMINLFITIMG